MEMFFSLLTLAGIGYGLYRGIVWMLRSARRAAPREQPLTPNDLKVLEHSARQLMDELRAVSDECVAKVDAACRRAEQAARFSQPVVPDAARTDMRPAEPVMLTGEIELARSLREIVHR